MQIQNIEPTNIHAFRDESGFPRLTFDADVPAELGASFVHDVQTEGDAERILGLLQLVIDGMDADYSFSGNSFTVTIHETMVTIVDDIVEETPIIEMSHEQYRIILSGWREFLHDALR